MFKVSNIVNELQNVGHVYLCGDFNARISNHPGLLPTDQSNKHLPLPDDYINDTFTERSSRDEMTNNFCKDFLSLIMNNSLTIANGRTLGDFMGNYTCITHRGSSVVDYFSVSSHIYHTISKMVVLPFTIFSDHRPLHITLKTDVLDISPSLPIDKVYEPAPNRYIHDNDSKATFMDIQSFQEFTDRHNSIREKLTLTKSKQIENITRPDVNELNETYTEFLNDMAIKCFKQTDLSKKRSSKQPWFNWPCRSGKRLLNQAARAVSEHPKSAFLREQFYCAKKDYKKLIKKHETRYISNINKQIENGQIFNWNQFKRLKNNKADKTKFDSLDMSNFESFFANLYTDEHKTIDSMAKEIMLNMADDINSSSILSDELEAILNGQITTDEVLKCTKTLKNGKASSSDLISNEILKGLERNNIELLKDLFNICFDSGIYPWNANIITPLHKKGSKDNPDNYRAVAVSSVIGKLFSTILLGRFKDFRHRKCPDPPNQLGFTKGAQTYDHVLTMQTIITKYKKLKRPVYAIFVDFKKAFDSVCRPALFLKLAKSGATGKFYSVLKDMYQNSYGHIKLEGHLSKRFSIRKGTEQGHPLSPDLFKHFLSDLSPGLRSGNCPELAGMKISHLLWADDLILLSLDKATAQNQLNILHNFCQKWGIEVNTSKTKAMTISGPEIKTNDAHFTLGDSYLKNVDEYCYLGITIHKSGSLKTAIDVLKTKATRAFFGLKRTVMRSSVSFTAMRTLFDSLIKPVILYGAPIWLPSLSAVKQIAKELRCTDSMSNLGPSTNLAKKIANLPCEKVHLSFLRWALGVHRKSSTIGMWGDTGRYPLIYQAIKLTLDYYKRIEGLNTDSIVSAALREQKNLNLPWFKTIKSLLEIDDIFHNDHVSAFRILHPIKAKSMLPPANTTNTDQPKHQGVTTMNPQKSEKFRPSHILNRCKEHFVRCWKHAKNSSPKLNLFYADIKKDFKEEPYLKFINNAANKYRTTRLRISAHDLEIETGRYKNVSRNDRCCKWCSIALGNNTIEDERHVLFHCDLYQKPRNKLLTTLKNAANSILTEFPSDQSNIIYNLTRDYSSLTLSSLESTMFLLHTPHSDPNTPGETDSVGEESDRVNSTLSWHHSTEPAHKKFTHGIISTTGNVENLGPLRDHLNTYVHNAIGSFIGSCFKTRWEFLAELKDTTNKTITVTHVQAK